VRPVGGHDQVGVAQSLRTLVARRELSGKLLPVVEASVQAERHKAALTDQGLRRGRTKQSAVEMEMSNPGRPRDPVAAGLRSPMRRCRQHGLEMALVAGTAVAVDDGGDPAHDGRSRRIGAGSWTGCKRVSACAPRRRPALATVMTSWV